MIRITTRERVALFAEGKTDAFLGFPPEPQELRARGFSRVILNTVMDQEDNRRIIRDPPAGRGYRTVHVGPSTMAPG
jgi:hypothetical protein